eukprot:9469175-Pyramimonas_sp.AAC.1
MPCYEFPPPSIAAHGAQALGRCIPASASRGGEGGVQVWSWVYLAFLIRTSYIPRQSTLTRGAAHTITAAADAPMPRYDCKSRRLNIPFSYPAG